MKKTKLEPKIHMNPDLPSSSSKRQKSTNPKKIIQTQKIKHKNTRKTNPEKS